MAVLTVGRAGPAGPVRARTVAGVTGAGVAVALCVAGCVLLTWNVLAGAPAAQDGSGFWTGQVAGALAYGVVGGRLVVRRTAGPIGPLFLLVAVGEAAALLGREYGVHGMQVVDGLPGDRWVFWVHTWVWVPGLLALLLVVPLLLPDGRLPSPRWRPAVVLGAVTAAVATLGWSLASYDRLDGPPLDARIGPNPVAVPPGTADTVDLVSGPLLVLGAVLALSCLVVRWRRTDAEERRALAWVSYGAAVSIVAQAVVIAFDVPVLGAAAVVALPVCCLIAMTRHRLWDLQPVLRRSLLYGGLTAVVAAAYAGAVGLVGGAVGASTGAPIVATAVVAMLVLPVHQVLRRVVNGLVYGRAEDPYVTTTRLGLRLGAAVTPEQMSTVVLPDVLAEVARALPLRQLSPATVDGQTFAATGSTAPCPVVMTLRHAGRPVGELRAAPARGGLTRVERRALEDFATQSAVAVHGVVLMGELRRELHDGVGTALAAARLQAETARDLMADDPDEGLALLTRLEGQLRDAVVDVRAVTRNLRPALLDELGLAGAVHELGGRSAGPGRPVEVEVGELGEVPAAVEVAAYLVVAELVSNACRHSHASRVGVRVHRSGNDLCVLIADDGRGIGPDVTPGVGLDSVRRRVDEIGGELVRRDGPGTVIDARLPLGPR